MISTTLSDYKANYQAYLELFINGYEDNTESIFLQNDLEKYNNLLEILINHKSTFLSFGFQTIGEYFNSLELKNIGIDIDKPENYITSTKRIIEFITEEIASMSGRVKTVKNVGDTKYKLSTWFKVGLLFAKGELNEYYNHNKTGFKSGYSALKVATELGDEGYNKFILSTINNYPPSNTNADKNIYNWKNKMDKIIKHCNDYNIVIDEYFLTRLPQE